MGFAGISTTQLLIVLIIAVLLFGTSRIKQLGSDLGGMVKGFRKGARDLDDLKNELNDHE